MPWIRHISIQEETPTTGKEELTPSGGGSVLELFGSYGTDGGRFNRGWRAATLGSHNLLAPIAILAVLRLIEARDRGNNLPISPQGVK
jgi:hypothetical protein